MQFQNQNLLNWIVLIFLGAVWGSSFILIKKGLEGFSAVQVACLRISISMIILSPLIPFYWRKLKTSQIKHIALVGLFGSGVPPFMFALAQTRIDSSMAGILNATTPLLTFVLGVVFFRAIFNWSRLAGIIIGFLGALILLVFGQDLSMENFGFGILVMIGTLGYGLSVNMVKTYLQDVNAIVITVFAFVCIGIPALGYLFTTDFVPRLQNSPAALESIGYIGVLAILGTAIASMIFFKLTQRTNAVFASTVTYLIPVFAILWGFMVEEQLTGYHFIGMILILGGVYLSGQKKNLLGRFIGSHGLQAGRKDSFPGER